MLADTSVWIDHFRRGNAELAERLQDGEVECHPFVLGEIACGSLERRSEILSLLRALPRIEQAEHDEVLALIESRRLMGSGLGWVDVHLLASTLIARTTLWTLDRSLAAGARKLRILFD